MVDLHSVSMFSKYLRILLRMEEGGLLKKKSVATLTLLISSLLPCWVDLTIPLRRLATSAFILS